MILDWIFVICVAIAIGCFIASVIEMGMNGSGYASFARIGLPVALVCFIIAISIDKARGAEPASGQTCARLYAFTGLGGQTPGYSLGVFTEVDKIAKAYPCVKTYKRAWSDKTKTWATAKANYEIDGLPIFMVGHSMGADAALAIARWLANDNIPVATVFSYDPTRTQAGCVPSNVQTFINWRGTRFLNLGRGNPQPCTGNTATAMQDYPLNVPHVLLDDLPTVHAQTTKHVGEVLHMIEEMKGAQ